MTYYEDLAPCDYWGESFAPTLTAIGWIARGHAFNKDLVPNPVHRCIAHACARSWEPIELVYFGFHDCELCSTKPFRTANNVCVPDGSRMFVAPAGIIHYIDVHQYLPPAEFLDAVGVCAEIGSADYFITIGQTDWAQEWRHDALHEGLSLDERLEFERLCRLESQ